jgi:hypothetical protein
MTYVDLLAGLTIAALALAAGATGLAFTARRYAARALVSAHTHDRRRDDPPVPHHLARERREHDTGPPPGTPERRHRAPTDLRARRRDTDNPQWQLRPDDHPHRPDDDHTPRTEHLEPPTRDMRAQPPLDRK